MPTARSSVKTGPDDDTAVAPDPLMRTQEAATFTAAPNIGVNERGYRFPGVYPPDPAGEVGTTQYVHTANTGRGAKVAVYDKNSGVRVASFLMSSLAQSGPCRRGIGDGVPIFDQLADRWLLTQIARDLRSLCMYLSDTDDAAGMYSNVYWLTFNGLPDYPKWAAWPDAYYVALNNGPFPSPILALDRSEMLVGAASIDYNFNLVDPLRGFAFQIVPPVDVDGMTPPPVGSPGIFIRHVDDEVNRPKGSRDPTKDFIEYFEVTPNFASPTHDSVVNGPIDVPVSEFDSRLCGLYSLSCVPQRGTRRKLDPLREPMMNRPVLRDIGGTQHLVGSFTVDVGHNRAGVRWFELMRPTMLSGGWTLEREGTFSAPHLHTWLPSIDVNGAGNIALGYSASSMRHFPSVGVTGRLAADLPSDAMTQDPTTIVRSAGAQTFANRWGDYSEMSVDPVDDDTFWYTNEYLDRRGEWRTRIARFTLGP